MTIKNLFDTELAYWRAKNISLFGVNLIDDTCLFKDIQASLDDSCEKYWNVEKPCKLARYLNMLMTTATSARRMLMPVISAPRR